MKFEEKPAKLEYARNGLSAHAMTLATHSQKVITILGAYLHDLLPTGTPYGSEQSADNSHQV